MVPAKFLRGIRQLKAVQQFVHSRLWTESGSRLQQSKVGKAREGVVWRRQVGSEGDLGCLYFLL